MHKNDGLPLEDLLAYRAALLANVLSRSLAEVYKHEGLTVSQWRVMATVKNSVKCRAKDIANMAMIDKVAVSRIVNGLIERGLLCKEVNSDDKRAAFLTLSTKGNDIYKRLVPHVANWQKKLVEGISDDDFAVFSRVLDTLTQQGVSTKK